MLNLYKIFVYQSYASGSYLIAATSPEHAKELMNARNDDGYWRCDEPEQIPGQITGVLPGVVHSHMHIE